MRNNNLSVLASDAARKSELQMLRLEEDCNGKGMLSRAMQKIHVQNARSSASYKRVM
jgi:hypothetical protein